MERNKFLVDGILEIFCSHAGTMTHLIQLGGRSHFGATSPGGAGPRSAIGRAPDS